MRVIYGGRQTGRTTTLIELCAEAEARGEVSYIVCHTEAEAYRIAQRAKEMNLNIGFPISYNEFINGRLAGKNIKWLFVDNADYLLQYLCTIPIAAITVEKKETDDPTI